MATILQNFIGRYTAGFSVAASAKFSPKNDGSTAFVELNNLVDQTGAAIGVAGNPLITSGAGGGSAPYQATPLGYQQIAASTTLQGLTVPGTATYALVTTEGGAARWRDDGTNPTASVGMPIYSGAPPQQFSGDLSALKFIAESTNVIYNVSYYK